MLSIDDALLKKSSAVNLKVFDIGTFNVLQSAIGSTLYRNLPVPRDWDEKDIPHVALIDSTGDRVFSFLISHADGNDEEIWVKDIESIPENVVIEVKFNRNDYRYYRRTGNNWTMVAEKKDQFFVDIYQRGDYPVTVPTLDDNWSALD